MISCPSCGKENPEGFRYCGFCSTELVAARGTSEVRKTVTVVFCDVTGSTSMGERLDPETVRRVMGRYFEAMKAVVEAHGGTVEKFIGDAVMAVFGVPQVHEDDALRAVRAAVGMRERLGVLNKELDRDFGVVISSRIGVNTGEVVSGTGEATLVTGDAVNVAARLEQAAQPGEIWIGESTRRLVRDAALTEPIEPLELKGKAEPIAAHRLIDVWAEGQTARQVAGTLVGRDRELHLVIDAFEHAVSDRACHLVTILGVAGVGKSRLVAEAVAALPDGARVLAGRCLPYGNGITFWPVAELVKQAADIAESDTSSEAIGKVEVLAHGEANEDWPAIAARVCELIGLKPPAASLEEGFWAVRKLLETLAADRPLVATFDDLQWAEPAFLDLIEHIADWSRGASIVLIAMARPEFLEVRSTWGGGKMNAVSMLLESLDPTESETLIGDLLTGADVPASVLSKVLETSGGNPLFVEEVLANMAEAGHLVRDAHTWRYVGDLADLEVPATIHALLAARLDRLSPEELAVIEGASVVGQVFDRGAVAELIPAGLRPDIGTHLNGLVRKDLVRPDGSSFAGEQAFTFRHLLIRDTAYQIMPKQMRAESHERFARWLERTAPDRLAEYEEIVGYHLEQALGYRGELGPVDDETRRLGEEAGRLLGSAGVRAAKRGDYVASASLLERAESLCPDEPEAVDWLMRWARAQHILGDTALATAIHERAVAAGRASGSPALEWRTRLSQNLFLWWIDPSWSSVVAFALVEEAIPVLEALQDDYGLAIAWRLLGNAEASVGRLAGWVSALERAVGYALRSDAKDQLSAALGDLQQSMVWGPTPVEEALDRCREIMEMPEYTLEDRPWTSSVIAYLEGLAGHLEASAEALTQARASHAELGGPAWELMLQFASAGVDLLADDPAGAADGFLDVLEGQKATGDTAGTLALTTGFLAEALCRQGRDDEAEAYSRESERYSTSESMSQSMWRAVRARVLARRGELGEAERLAREAVEISATTDMLQLRGDVLLGLAEVLSSAGRDEESRKYIREAIDLYERKGATLLVERARALLDQPGFPA